MRREEADELLFRRQSFRSFVIPSVVGFCENNESTQRLVPATKDRRRKEGKMGEREVVTLSRTTFTWLSAKHG